MFWRNIGWLLRWLDLKRVGRVLRVLSEEEEVSERVVDT